jgi:hypothetical protein
MKLAVARVPLVTFNDCAKAAPIQRRLANAGIAAETDDQLLEKLWFVSKEESDARIDVPMDQLERAKSFCSSGTRPKKYCARRFAALNAGHYRFIIRSLLTGP